MVPHTFQLRHINRLKYPDKVCMICEDDLHHQMEISTKMEKMFERQGRVEFNFVASGVLAAAQIMHMRQDIKLIILDHDMPRGNASDLIEWMDKNEVFNIPVITFSGIPQNNDHMYRLLTKMGVTCHKYNKKDVIEGLADEEIHKYLS